MTDGEAMDAAEKPKRRAKTGTNAAMEAFLRSDTYLSKSPACRHKIKRECNEIVEQAEDALASHLRADDIGADLKPLAPAQVTRPAQGVAADLCMGGRCRAAEI